MNIVGIDKDLCDINRNLARWHSDLELEHSLAGKSERDDIEYVMDKIMKATKAIFNANTRVIRIGEKRGTFLKARQS